jgi:hypothetical protein
MVRSPYIHIILCTKGSAAYIIDIGMTFCQDLQAEHMNMRIN